MYNKCNDVQILILCNQNIWQTKKTTKEHIKRGTHHVTFCVTEDMDNMQ